MCIKGSQSSTSIGTGRDRLSCDFKSSKQLFEELIQSNRFAFTKWIPLNIKAYKYSQLIQTEKKPYVYFMHVNMLIELRIPFLVSLSYEALISDRKILENAQSP